MIDRRDFLGGAEEISVPERATRQVVHVDMLDGFRVRFANGAVLSAKTGRLQSLFCYLIMHKDQSQRRSRLAALFWPESSERQARTNLRQLLHHLRAALPEPRDLLVLQHDDVELSADYQIHADVSRFRKWLACASEVESKHDYQTMIDALERAVKIYRGELLPGCYDQWIVDERASLEQAYLDALRRLAGLLESLGELDAAIKHAQSLLAHDPIDEATSRCLMRALAARGDRAELHRVYHRFSTELERELGVSPTAETQSLFAALLETPDEREESIVLDAADGEKIPGTTPMLERRGEWLRLLACWQSVRQRPGRIALISAEMGAGKTRLALDFGRHVRQRGGRVAVVQCYSAARGLAFAPMREWLRSGHIKQGFATLDPVWLSEISRLLPELQAEFPHLVPPPPLRDSWQRQNFLEAIARALLAAGEPLLLVIDDIQECDDETLEWLQFLFRFDSRAPILVVATLRLEDLRSNSRLERLLVDFRREERLIEMTPKPLTLDGVGRIAAHLLGSVPDPAAIKRLYARTRGNPLFVVESIRFDSLAHAPGTGNELPPKIESVVQARFAELPPSARALVSLAATIDESFSVEFLARASALDEDSVLADLNLVWRRRIIQQRDGIDYDFAHPYFREVAANAIDAPEAQRLHLAIARALESSHGRDNVAVGARLSAHYEGAGMHLDAIRALRGAARAALDVYANEQAIRYLQHAVTLLGSLPPSPDRDRLELDLLIALGAPLVVTKGYAVAEARDVYTQAVRLSNALGERSRIAPALRGLSIAFVELGKLGKAIEIGQELLNLGAQIHDPMLTVEGHYSIGVARFWRGDFEDSRRELEHAVKSCRDVDHAAHIPEYGQSPLVVCLVRLAFTLWHLGRADEALEKQTEALEQAQALDHPYSLAYALSFSAWLHYFRRDVDATEPLAERLLKLCAERGFQNWHVMAEILVGWCQSQRGRIDSGAALVNHALDDAASPLNLMNEPFGLSVLAEIHRRAGDSLRARSAIDKALRIVESGETRWLHAELLRQQALIDSDTDGPASSAVVSRLRRALRIAQAQGARFHALRAASDLAELEERS